MILTVSLTDVVTISAQDLANGVKRAGARKAFAHKIYNYNLDFSDKIPYNDDMQDIVTETINTMLKDTGTSALNIESAYTAETGLISMRFSNNAKMLYPEYTFSIMFSKNGKFYENYIENFDDIEIQEVSIDE